MNELISKQVAIDAINSHFGFNIEEEYGSAVQEVINGLPSAGPHWILCSERPPKEDVDVLCKTLGGVKLVASYGKLNPWTEEKGWITSEFNRFSTDMVKEWMPLPE